MKLTFSGSGFEYDIILEKGALDKIEEYINLNRRVLLVTDDNLPHLYVAKVAVKCPGSDIIKIPQGENGKNFDSVKMILERLFALRFSRNDCVIAVGGGVVGDVAGFAASIYMRGIDFYNIPTTLLSQVDSSVGGKTGINFCGAKNSVGSFYQPKRVIIDTNTLKTLPKRQISNGLAESIKMAITNDKELFELIENEPINENLEKIIEASLKIKMSVVAQDEKEKGLRRVLNFGHTIGHAIEMTSDLYHGECVAIGAVAMCNDSIRERVINVFKKAELPTSHYFNENTLLPYILHDKKVDGLNAMIVTSREIGTFEIQSAPIEIFKIFFERIKEDAPPKKRGRKKSVKTEK